MKITTRKASTLAIALAVPATSIAGTSAALAEDSTSGKEISINVNLGSDAADSDVTLLAGDEEVGTETADESGKVSFSYNGKDTEELTVEVDGESITLSDAQCTAAKDSTGSTASGSDSASTGESTSPSSDPSSSVDPSEDGSSDSSKPDISSIVDKISGKASDLINGAGSGIGGDSTSSDPSTESTDSDDPSTESTSSEKPSADSTDPSNTDGSGSRTPEALEALEKVEKQSDINASTNKTIQGDAKEAEKLSDNLEKLANSKDAEDLNLDRSKIKSTINDLDKAIKEQEADGSIQISPELQEKIASLAKAAIGTAYPQYAPIANPIIDVSSKVVASAINLLAEQIDLGSILDKDGSSSDSSEGTSPENGTPASSSQDGASDASNGTPSSDEVDLDSNVEDKSFTVNLQEGVSSVDCDVETESSDEDEDASEDTSSASDNGSETSQAPESPTPASGSGSAASGPKVNTGGEVQGKSFFSKIKSLF